MGKITKGFKYIGAGIVDLLAGGVKLFARAIGAVIKSHRKRKLKKATAYVEKYGYELQINSRVRFNNTPYYVMSYEYFEDVERKREVSIKLIGVPQHKEMMRRIKSKEPEERMILYRILRKQESFLALRLKLWRLREELQKRLSLMENRKRL